MIQVNAYANVWNAMSFDEREQRRMQVIQKVTFNLPIGAISFSDHPLVNAFHHGFNLLIKPSANLHLLDMFGSKSKEFFPILTQRLPKDGASICDLIRTQVNDRYKVEEDPEVWADSPPSLYENAEKFERLLKRYLQGVGHVQHSDLQGLISPEEYRQYAGDSSLRAHKFLLYATGREVLPTHTTVHPRVCESCLLPQAIIDTYSQLVFNHIICEENQTVCLMKL